MRTTRIGTGVIMLNRKRFASVLTTVPAVWRRLFTPNECVKTQLRFFFYSPVVEYHVRGRPRRKFLEKRVIFIEKKKSSRSRRNYRKTAMKRWNENAVKQNVRVVWRRFVSVNDKERRTSRNALCATAYTLLCVSKVRKRKKKTPFASRVVRSARILDTARTSTSNLANANCVCVGCRESTRGFRRNLAKSKIYIYKSNTFQSIFHGITLYSCFEFGKCFLLGQSRSAYKVFD